MTKKYELVSLEERLCFSLYVNSKEIISKYSKRLANIGMTYPQYIVFLALWDVKELSVKHIGEKLGLDSGTLTPLLMRMESNGLVSRERSDSDQRLVLVSLTPKARLLVDEVAETQAEVSCATGLEKSEMNTLVKLLKKLRTNLSESHQI